MRCGWLVPLGLALGGCGDPGPDTNGFDDGVATFEFADKVGFSGFAPMADGGLVAYGGQSDVSHLVLKLDATGRPDLAFGDRGIVTLPAEPDAIDFTFSVYGRADGRVLLVSSVEFPPRIRVRQLDASGDLDPTFGDQGVVTEDLSDVLDDYALAFPVSHLDTDGSLTIVTYPRSSVGRYRAIAIVVSPDGSIAGRANHLMPWSDSWNGVTRDDSGNILVFGSTGSSSDSVAIIGRLTPSLALDATYTGASYARRLPQGSSVGGPVALPGGRFAVVLPRIKIMIVNASGEPDSGFGQAGVATAAGIPQDDAGVSYLFALPDGSVLAQASPYVPDQSSFGECVVRVLADGTRDEEFGLNCGDARFGSGLVSTTDGSIYAAGGTHSTLYLRRLPITNARR